MIYHAFGHSNSSWTRLAYIWGFILINTAQLPFTVIDFFRFWFLIGASIPPHNVNLFDEDYDASYESAFHPSISTNNDVINFIWLSNVDVVPFRALNLDSLSGYMDSLSIYTLHCVVQLSNDDTEVTCVEWIRQRLSNQEENGLAVCKCQALHMCCQPPDWVTAHLAGS